MNIVIWVAQGLLALMFLMAGFMKLTQPKATLLEKVGGWVEGFSDGQIKMIGLVELLGSIGLVLPMLLNIYPFLTPVAALGLAVTMVGAAIVHLKRKESVFMNMALLALALFVAIARFLIIPVI